MAGYVLNQIVTGDARRLARSIPDGSVDLIFTDPVYERIQDYGWLARQARRVLRPGGAVLAWCAKPKQAACQRAMERGGLQYVYDLDYVVQAKTRKLFNYRIFTWTTPCLWMSNGPPTPPRRFLPDTFVSTAAPSGSFKWNKNTGVITSWLEAFTAPGAVVWDPFTGSGTVPVVCRMTGRSFLAGELEPERAAEARERLEQTPIPHPALIAEQMGLEEQLV